MKKLILVYILVLGAFVTVKAQQIPLYSQYYYNPFLYNPAMAGYSNTGNVFLIDREQWTGIPGAPVTRAFTIDGPLKTNKIGLGLGVYDDQTDIFDRMGLFGSYAYNIRFAENNELRLGLSAGVLNNRIDFMKVRVKDPRDQTILSQYQDKAAFDGTFGAAYHYKNLLLGFAVPQLLAPKLTYAENSNLPVYYSLVRHYILSGQYDIPFSDNKWRLQPMVYTQYAEGAPFMLDAGVNVKYKDLAWLGLMWRKDFAVSMSAGIKINGRISLGYSYDMMTNAIAPFAGATHEFVIGYAFGKGAGMQNDIQEKIKALNDRLDNDQKKHKATNDSLRNELNKSKQKIEEQNNIIEKEHRDFENFKREMLDSLGKMRNGMSYNQMPGEKKETGDNFPSYVLNNINFEDQSATLISSSYQQLDQLSEILKKNPNMKIEIDGYCDNRGDDAFNLKLSKDRASAVMDYLLKHGAGKNQVTSKGFGKSHPVADNSTPEGMAKNRRVEMKILSR